ncbi:MAG: hypothetical protein ABJZ69_06930 [Hyphomicrobiales bacterium]
MLLLVFAFPMPILAQISDPLDVPGAVIWLDGTDVNGTGSQPTNGSLVPVWVDKSGNGNDVTATAALAPTFEATGFDGANPGLRFTASKKMSGGNIFGVNNQPATTIFFVSANVTITRNFALNLNGDNTSTSSANGRFSFHTPWSNNSLFFDAGACCGATRLSGANPNGITETTLYSAGNDQPGSSQFLRVDGAPFASDNSAISPRVTGGIRIGSTSGRSYNGRYAEIVIYNRALSMTEIHDVECYLLTKWKPSARPTSCVTTADLSITKTNTPGINGEIDQANDTVTSGTTTAYTLVVTNNGPDAITGAIVTDAPSSGITCPGANPVTITGSGVPAGAFTFSDLIGSGVVLATLSNGEQTTLTYSCSVN